MKSGFMKHFLDKGIPVAASAEERRLLRFHRLSILLMCWVAPALAAIALSIGERVAFAVLLAVFGSYFVALELTLRGRHTASKVLYNYGVITATIVLYVMIGGPNSAYLWFFSTLVYAAAVYSSIERGYKYFSIALSSSLFIACTLNNTLYGGIASSWISEQPALGLVLAGSDILALIVAGTIVVFLSESVRATETKLVAEHRKSENLLLNILPRPVAERLKDQPEVIAEGFPQVSVLFSDLVGFTRMSETLSPHRIVELLNGLFSRFDMAAEELGLEKIKTIGDAYMAVGGLPMPAADHARRCAAMALRMLSIAKEFGADRGLNLEMRIGIHSGPVVAGVIGQSKFAYDLWGDTVNTASRMESEGVPNKIQVSSITRELLEQDYVFEARGQVEIKGKGLMTTSFLLGPRK